MSQNARMLEAAPSNAINPIRSELGTTTFFYTEYKS
jgi:hypothetical protein